METTQLSTTNTKEKQAAFLKTCKVIYSCKSISQLKVALNFKARYFQKYGFSQYIENQYDHVNRSLIIADFLKTQKN